METVRLDSLLEDKSLQEELIKSIQKGAVFIYPTDTIYGIGCDASNPEAVRHIRGLKGSEHPFSVVASSKEWINRHLVVKGHGRQEYVDKLPGPYTLIFEKKDKDFLREAAPGGSLGVRIPDHPLTWILQKTGLPIVTTSANVSGSPFLVEPEDIKDYFDVDFFIDAGRLPGNPSKVVDLTGHEPRIIRP
jgi:L-threonylcarbamoyladenylate synthase